MLKAIFEKISNIGSSNKYGLREVKAIRLANQISLIASLFCLISMGVNLWMGYYLIALFPLIVGGLFAVGIGMNYFEKHHLAKVFLIGLSLLSTTFINAAVNFDAHFYYYFLTTFLLSFIFFPTAKGRFFALITHFFCISAAFIISSQLENPLIGSVDLVIFEVINTILVISILYIILNTITRENQRFEKRTVELLSSITDKNKELKYEKARAEEHAIALKITNANLQKEVRERKKMEEALRVSNEALQKFAYVASHDLKEPLRTINSFTRLLERQLGSNVEKTTGEYFNFIVSGTERMATLLDDLLAYSRLNKKVVFTQVDLNNTIEIIKYNLRDLLERKNATIICNDLPRFKANRSQLSQVFQNLISNGLKFNKQEQPKVEIACEETMDEYIFSVRDNGIGIEAAYQDQIFMIFQRLHDRGAYEGSGIGLAICKKVIDNHNGRIWLYSIPNVGTTFYFTIPKNLLSNSLEVKNLRAIEAEAVKQN